MKLKHVCICLLTIVVSLLPISNVCAQNTQTNWTFMGKVLAVCSIEKYWDKGTCIRKETEWVLLYSSFDGEKMAYKIYVPAKDEALQVKKSLYYNGETIEWSRNGKYITKFPSLLEMYTHYAIGKGQGYYFNVTDIRKD